MTNSLIHVINCELIINDKTYWYCQTDGPQGSCQW